MTDCWKWQVRYRIARWLQDHDITCSVMIGSKEAKQLASYIATLTRQLAESRAVTDEMVDAAQQALRDNGRYLQNSDSLRIAIRAALAKAGRPMTPFEKSRLERRQELDRLRSELAEAQRENRILRGTIDRLLNCATRQLAEAHAAAMEIEK